MLKIVKASEPLLVEKLTLCIYSAPGLGKTSLAFTAESPLLFDCDNGAYRAHNRKDTVAVSKWADIESVDENDLAPYKTVIVDTAGRALDFLTDDIIAKNPKHGNGGALTMQGFGQLKSRFLAWSKMLRRSGKDLVLIAHMAEERKGDDIIERLDVQGGSKGEIYKSADAMGRIFVKNSGERFIDFNPRENSFGKNPCQLPIMPLPLAGEKTLAEIIATIKDRLNASVAEAKTAGNELQDWNIAINDCANVNDLNGLLPEIRKAPASVRFIAQKKARELGLVYDQRKQLYLVGDQPVAAGAR